MNKQRNFLNKTLLIGVIILLFGIVFNPVTGNIPLSITEKMNSSGRITWIEKSTDHWKDTLDSSYEFVIEIIQQMNETLYLGYLEDITAFGARVTGTNGCHEAGDYIYNEFENMGIEVRYHYWNYGGYSDRNIEATLFGTNEMSDEIYIICGHYDTVANCPGADDDASGVATVLSAAYILRNYGFNHTIRFVAFSGEEQWMLGSHEYAREAYENGDNIIAVLNVDMIGFAITSTHGSNIKIYKNEASKWISDFTITISQEYYDYIFLDVIPLGESPSDQYYFWEYGYDGVFYHEYEFNDYYHTPQDTIENMNITYATKFSKLIVATIALLAQLSSNPPEAPTISGPANGIIDHEYDFTVVTTDPDEDNVYYYIDWGDDTSSGWIGPNSTGEEVIISHIWSESGIYEIKGKAKDINGVQSNWSEPAIISIVENKIPERPAIDGKHFGFGGVAHEFTFVSTDADGHDIYYRVDWDDDIKTDWLGPYSSGEQITLNHSWKKKGEYWIKSWSKDIYGDISGQGMFRINILTNSVKTVPVYRNLLFIQILESLINRFPIIDYLLNRLKMVSI